MKTRISKMKTRITADLDDLPYPIVKARTKAIIYYLYNNLNIIIDNYELRQSSGKKGYHVILWTTQKLSKDTIFFIRFLLGDDHKRIILDIKRKRPLQFLFRKKIIKKNHFIFKNK